MYNTEIEMRKNRRNKDSDFFGLLQVRISDCELIYGFKCRLRIFDFILLDLLKIILSFQFGEIY